MPRSIMARRNDAEHALMIVKPIARGREHLVEQFIHSLGGKVLEKQEVLCSALTIGKHYAQFRTKPFYRNILSSRTELLQHLTNEAVAVRSEVEKTQRTKKELEQLLLQEREEHQAVLALLPEELRGAYEEGK